MTIQNSSPHICTNNLTTVPSQQWILKRPGKWLFFHQNLLRLETILGIARRTYQRDLYLSSTGSNFLTNFFDFKTLGRGSFGTVIKVKKRPFQIGDEFDVLKFNDQSYSFQDEFAVKIIPNYQSDAATSEIKSLALANLIHPNIVSCYNAWDWEEQNETVIEDGWNYIGDKLLDFKNKSKKGHSYYSDSDGTFDDKFILSRCLFLQYELCSGGTLHDVLESRDKLKWEKGECTIENKNLFLQILQGLIYLQYQGVIHGDLKPDNIFIIKRGDVKIAKIGDFGLSLNVNESHFSTINDLLQPLESHDSVNSEKLKPDGNVSKGIPRIYMPPEYMENIRSHKGDMYSFGLVFFITLIPFKTIDERRLAVVNAMCSKNGKYPSQLLQDFPVESEWIEQLLNHEMSARPSALELRDIIDKHSIEKIVSGYDVINYGENPHMDETFNSLAFGLDFCNQANYKHGYRYLSSEFHTYFKRIKSESEIPNSLTKAESLHYDFVTQMQEYAALNTLSIIAAKLGKTHDEYYRHSEYLRTLLRNNSNSTDNFETIKAKFKIVTILEKMEEDSIYKELVRSGLPEKYAYINEILTSIESSPIYQKLEWKSEWKLEVEMAICKNLVNQGDAKSLEKALKKLLWIEQGIKENNQNREDLYLKSNVNFDLEPQQFTLLKCRILSAKVHYKLGREDTSKEMFLWLLESSFLVYKEGISTLQSMNYLLAEYAGFILLPLKRFETAVIYLQASYEFRRTFHGMSYASYNNDKDELLILLYYILGLKEDMDAFIKFEFVQTQRVQDFYMLSPNKSNESLFKFLLDSNKFYEDLEKIIAAKSPGFSLKSTVLVETDVKNSLGRRYKSAEELVNYPPNDFGGWWHSEVIKWAKRFLSRVNYMKSKEVVVNKDLV